MKTYTALLVITGWMAASVHAAAVIAGSDEGYLYLSPVPNASYIAPENRRILVRFDSVTPDEVANLGGFITVTGAVSGAHTGVTHVASDGRTVSFEVPQDFTSNEVVTVSLNPQLHPHAAGTVDPYQYQFRVAAMIPGSQPAVFSELDAAPDIATAPVETASTVSIQSDGPGILPNGVAVPAGFPFIEITASDNPDPGYIFIDNHSPVGLTYKVIFDNRGYPVWYSRTEDGQHDMKVQRNGMLTMLERDEEFHFIGLDTNYVETTEYRTVNGYDVDEHELVVLEDGTYFLIGRRLNPVDMSQYVAGGRVNATVRETVIQEFTAADELIFQWRAWDHYDIRNNHISWPTGSYVRFPHMNAIEVDLDGHLLVSCRHLSEITKINRDTGDIIWRLGGASNDFSFVSDSFNGFSAQHSIRVTGTNRYILFDNGNLHVPAESRAVEYELDFSNMTATVIWEYRGNPPRYSRFMSNVQRLPNGNTLINWAIGHYPKLTEVRPDGTIAFEMNWVDEYETYRTWRHPWNGRAVRPYLIADPTATDITLIFNQFGDTNISHYNIYGGTEPGPTNLVATSTVPLKHLTNVVNGVSNYWRVAAVNNQGQEGLLSNEESLLVNIVQRGQNLIMNGDFSDGKNDWIWELQAGGSAGWLVDTGVSHFSITNGGTQIDSVQLRQPSIPLIQGEDYTFEFDAWSAQPRILVAKVEQDGGSYINYSGIQPLTITPVNTRYRYTFTMNDPSDSQARVVFNVGYSSADVYIDNVSLAQVVYAPGDFDRDGCVGYDDLKTLTERWMDTGTLPQDLNGDGRVDFGDYVIFSENWSGDGACP